MSKALCVDIGGTRIKASVLPERLPHAALKKQHLYLAETLGWLNQSLPELLSTDNPLSLVNQSVLADDYDDIGICVPGPVKNSGFVSTNAMENHIGCNVRLLSALQNEIDTNLLSLIGLHKLVFSDSVRVGE